MGDIHGIITCPPEDPTRLMLRQAGDNKAVLDNLALGFNLH